MGLIWVIVAHVSSVIFRLHARLFVARIVLWLWFWKRIVRIFHWFGIWSPGGGFEHLRLHVVRESLELLVSGEQRILWIVFQPIGSKLQGVRQWILLRAVVQLLGGRLADQLLVVCIVLRVLFCLLILAVCWILFRSELNNIKNCKTKNSNGSHKFLIIHFFVFF